MCAERGPFLVFLQYKMIHRYTWRRRDERGEQKSVIDYIAVNETLRKGVLNAKAVKGMLERLNHYVVSVKIKKGRWEYGKKVGKVLASERMDRKEEYERKM